MARERYRYPSPSRSPRCTNPAYPISQQSSTSSRQSRHSSQHRSSASGSSDYPTSQPSSTSSHQSRHSQHRSSASGSMDRPTPPSRFSSYSPTTVSAYRRRIDVDGLPGPDYFSSGRSKVDRRREYITPPTPATPPTSVPGLSSLRGSACGGREMVKYRSRVDGEEEDDDDDCGTLCPSDSISQVSYPSSPSHFSRGREREVRRDSAVGAMGVGVSTFSSLSTFQGERVFDSRRGVFLVERRPRASVRREMLSGSACYREFDCRGHAASLHEVMGTLAV